MRPWGGSPLLKVLIMFAEVRIPGAVRKLVESKLSLSAPHVKQPYSSIAR
ncbi:hypothetical protein [Metallosphaera hakonensis]|nr:hypothetical protein [Metallosphaera hakonensis]